MNKKLKNLLKNKKIQLKIKKAKKNEIDMN